MPKMARPILSIGMIFRDDIRSLERCLKALQPLRDALYCELVMADTGSEDGSREVAEKYADILFEFPWINDFSAARNAVMDRCSGRWFLTVDSDEYLDEDISELVRFLRANNRKAGDVCTVIQRNYGSYEMFGPYTDFMAVRMVRMSTGLHYQGLIHERWPIGEDGVSVTLTPLSKTVLHHDGYVGLGGKAGEAKRARNIKLIREEIKAEPDDLLRRLQFIESGATEPDLMDQLRQAIALVEEKKPKWDIIGPAILRHAVFTAWQTKLPEIDEWTEKTWELFPESIYTRIDVGYVSFMRSWEKEDFASCITQGEQFLDAIRDYENGADLNRRMVSVIKMASKFWVQDVKMLAASAHLHQAQPDRAFQLLQDLDCAIFDVKLTRNLVKALREVHARSDADTSNILCAFWDGIVAPNPNQYWADQRKQVFLEEANVAFLPSVIENEKKNGRIIAAPLIQCSVLWRVGIQLVLQLK